MNGWLVGSLDGALGVGTTYCSGSMVSPSVNRGSTVGVVGGTMVGLMGCTVPGVFLLVIFLWVWGARLTNLGAVGLVDVGIASVTL